MPELERLNQSYRIDKRCCTYDFYFDKTNNILHIIDLHEHDTLSCAFILETNPIGFVYHIHKQFSEFFKFRLPPNFRLFLYSADKIVYEWKNDERNQIPIREYEKIHLPYLRKKRERKVAYLE